MSTVNTDSIKVTLMEIAQSLPEGSTWDDVMYRIYARQKIEAGLRDIEEGQLIDHEDIVRESKGPRP